MQTFEIPREPTRIWDLEVPIVINDRTNVVTAYLSGPISTPEVYNELCYLLHTADDKRVFTLFINTPGGVIDAAIMLSAAIKASAAMVVCHLSGTVASAGTLIALSCDKIVTTPHLSFMVHNYSGGMSGKGHEMRARQEFTDTHLNSAFKSFYSGFLDESEMQSVIDGSDMWMNTGEVEARLLKRDKYLEELNEELEAEVDVE